MIRSSKHTLKFCNKQKLLDINCLISNYRKLLQEIIDHIWLNSYNDFSISKNKLNCPSFVDSNYLKQFNTDFTERLKQCAAKQALAMISAATEKRRKQLWQLKELQKNNQNTKYLQRKISLFPLIKPNASHANLELDSRFIDFDFSDQKEFLCFVRLLCINKGKNIKIPIVYTPVLDKWNNIGKLKNSIRLSEKNIILIFEVEEQKKKISGDIVGCDQGIKDIITLSDHQTAPLYQEKYSLADVQKKLSRKKKGSKAFLRTQEFRKNMINWSINQLNFNNIKELRVEKLVKVRHKHKSSRFLSHWTYTLINDKLYRVSEEKGFVFKEMSNEFRSQRCSCCGWVRKANRKGKTFCCNKCNNTLDADLNAASNLELDLYEMPYWVRLKKINRKGFYWRHDGIFSESQEPIVPDTKEG
jgi:transposase